jgi:hypothetical protein
MWKLTVGYGIHNPWPRALPSVKICFDDTLMVPSKYHKKKKEWCFINEISANSLKIVFHFIFNTSMGVPFLETLPNNRGNNTLNNMFSNYTKNLEQVFMFL